MKFHIYQVRDKGPLCNLIYVTSLYIYCHCVETKRQKNILSNSRRESGFISKNYVLSLQQINESLTISGFQK